MLLIAQLGMLSLGGRDIGDRLSNAISIIITITTYDHHHYLMITIMSW